MDSSELEDVEEDVSLADEPGVLEVSPTESAAVWERDASSDEVV